MSSDGGKRSHAPSVRGPRSCPPPLQRAEGARDAEPLDQFHILESLSASPRSGPWTLVMLRRPAEPAVSKHAPGSKPGPRPTLSGRHARRFVSGPAARGDPGRRLLRVPGGRRRPGLPGAGSRTPPAGAAINPSRLAPPKRSTRPEPPASPRPGLRRNRDPRMPPHNREVSRALPSWTGREVYIDDYIDDTYSTPLRRGYPPLLFCF